jgi:hypothetical protein
MAQPCVMTSRVSLAELAAADIRLHPAEAVALVAALCRRQSDGDLRGVPSPGIIRLTRDGDVVVEGPVTTGDGVVVRMAQLLSDLLPGFDAPPDVRASGGLRLVIARALGTLDLPSYESVDGFADALDRFTVPDLRASVRCLFCAWEEKRRSAEPTRGPLTISDVRRARRATGLTLDDIATVARVPAPLLRELEWGYFRNWPRTDEGRESIVRYARAAGLDEAVVFSIAWPLVEESAVVFEPRVATMTGLVPVGPQAIAIAPWPASAPPFYRHWIPWVVALAAIVLLTIATFSLVRQQPVPPPAPVTKTSAIVEEDRVPASAAAPVSPRADRDAAAAARPALRPRRTASRAATPAKRPAARRQPPAPSRSFLHKELFRIVFR